MIVNLLGLPQIIKLKMDKLSKGEQLKENIGFAINQYYNLIIILRNNEQFPRKHVFGFEEQSSYDSWHRAWLYILGGCPRLCQSKEAS